MNGYLRIATVLFFLSALCGCAHDKLLRLETQDYVKVAEKTEASGRAFYDGMIEGDRALWAELYAIDEKCTPKSLGPSAFSADTNGDRNIDGKDRGFCLSLSDEKDIRVSNEIDRGMFQRQYAALAFLRSYLTALATASADPELSAEKEFKAAAADFEILLNALKNLKKKKKNAEGKEEALLSDDQIGVVSSLIGSIEELSKNHTSAKEIRRAVESNRYKVNSAFDVLTAAMKEDKSLSDLTIEMNSTLNSYVALQATSQDKTREARKKLIFAHYQRIDAQEKESRRILACNAAADTASKNAHKSQDDEAKRKAELEKQLCEFPEAGAMLAAKQASLDFIDLALEGRMSAKQKARLIKMQRENFMRAVSIFIDVTTAF